MILFKSCPRCKGDRTLENDLDGWYILCLACGHVAYPDVEEERRETARERRSA